MNNYPNKWVFGDDPQHPVLAVSVIEPLDVETINVMEQRDISGISRLNPLLQALPTFATAQHVAQHNYMEVMINGPLARVKDGIGFRGFSLGENGIKEHAVLLDANKLGNLVNTGLLLQTASVLLAQKHLADINEKLTVIAEDVNSIIEFQNNERTASIASTIKYLRQIAPAIQEGELPEAIRHKLEDFEVQFSSIQTHLLKDINTASTQVKTCHDPDYFSTNGITCKLKSLQQTLQERILEWNMATSVRVYALQLLSLYDGESRLKTQRQQAIKEDIQDFNKVISTVESNLRSRIDEIKAFTESSNATNANKIMLRKWITLRLEKQKQQVEGIRQSFEQFNQRLGIDQSEPTRLIVEMKDGQPVKLLQRS